MKMFRIRDASREFRFARNELLVIAATLLLMVGGTLASQAQTFNVEVIAGGVLADTEIKGAETSLSSAGGVAGLGIGVDLYSDRFVLGALARYSLMSAKGQVFGIDVENDRLWEVAARAGFRLNEHVLPYVLVGWSGTAVKASILELDSKVSGLMFGGGLELTLSPQMFMRAEYTYHSLDSVKAMEAVELAPAMHLVRVAVGFKFNPPESLSREATARAK